MVRVAKYFILFTKNIYYYIWIGCPHCVSPGNYLAPPVNVWVGMVQGIIYTAFLPFVLLGDDGNFLPSFDIFWLP